MSKLRSVVLYGAFVESIKHRLDQATFLLTRLAVVLPLISIAVSQIFLSLAFLCFLTEKVLKRQASISFPPIKFPLSLFMATTLMAYLSSPEPGMGGPPLRKFLLFVIILLVANKFSNARVLQTYYALFILGCLAATFSIYQYFFLSRGSVEARLTGFMGHWMTLSGEMMLVLIGLATYFIFANPLPKFPWLMAFCVVGLSLVLTLTRSVWLATLAGLLILLWMRLPHWKTLLVSALSTGLLLLMAPRGIQSRIESVLDSSNPSNYARVSIWKAGLRMVEAHPWVGVGPQRVSKVFYDYHPIASDRYRDGFFPVHMHNNLLQFAAERGIPCALSWLWLVLKIGLDHWRGFRQEPFGTESKTIYALGFISVVVFFLAGMFEFNFGDSEVLMIFLFLVSAPYVAEIDTSKGTSSG